MPTLSRGIERSRETCIPDDDSNSTWELAGDDQGVKVTESSLQGIVPSSVRFKHGSGADYATVNVQFAFEDQASESERVLLEVTLLDQGGERIAGRSEICQPEKGGIAMRGPVDLVIEPINSPTMTFRAAATELARTTAMLISFTRMPDEIP